ncbi:DUF3566 domain-containing protein [Streptomyces celluloflavus]|uniref:DUF3566 domain-containing protein n=1 Tax=Streptomyces kasugaensis TaxID=1946 RepID=A0A4Q9HM85_STRKA|nr:DUF3566 domain-containing protein [Streptomyces kasugaensis]MYU54854.1 hypothetical protein [Streptomyces sp. SID7805]TBO55908.1 DUF3566 domain-containing protein [Streptomyces kasugaensis]
MSGATGAAAGGPGTEKGSPSGPATVTEDSARGSAVAEDSRQEGSYQGGTVTDTRQPYPQPHAQSQGGQQPYQPPQAYSTGGTKGAGQQSARLPRTDARTTPRTRKARLRVARADPWSVMKVSFLLSIALGICTIVAVSVLWMVMDAMGVFSAVGGTISDATGADGGGFNLQSFLSLPRVLLFTTIISVIDVVLATALGTLGAFIYNLSAGFVGGVELTLAEDE